MRAIYGTDDQRNALHGSDGLVSAEREIRFFFPDAVFEPVNADAVRDYLAKNVNPTLIRGLTELCKAKPKDPVVRLLLIKFYYKLPSTNDMRILRTRKRKYDLIFMYIL